VEQTRHVQLRTCAQETFFRHFGNLLPCQHPCARCLCVVVPPVRTGTGEADVPDTTEAGEMSVHELTPVIRMEGEDAPWVPAETFRHRSHTISHELSEPVHVHLG